VESPNANHDRGPVTAKQPTTKLIKKKPTAKERFDVVHAVLVKKLGRTPTTIELAARLKVTTKRVHQIVAEKVDDAGAPLTDADGIALSPRERSIAVGIHSHRHRRCVLGNIPANLDPVEQLVIANMQRVYRDLIASPTAPSDGEIGTRAGFQGRPDQNANEIRKYIEGTRLPSLARLGKISMALGVGVFEMFREAT